MKNITIYTDGAYSSSRNQGGIGIVILKNDEPILEYSKEYSPATNNKMELGALIIALRMIKKEVDSILICSDSQYVLGCAFMNWKRNKNKTMWLEFDKELERVKTLCPSIQYKHVKGHSGDKWNEYVDKLAVKASQRI